MSGFSRQQEQMKRTMETTVGGLFPSFEEMGKQNMAMLERAMSLFSPFRATETMTIEQLREENERLRAEVTTLRGKG
jgi:polyhydroxyalkanoate synthesis regulator protein